MSVEVLVDCPVMDSEYPQCLAGVFRQQPPSLVWEQRRIVEIIDHHAPQGQPAAAGGGGGTGTGTGTGTAAAASSFPTTTSSSSPFSPSLSRWVRVAQLRPFQNL